MAPRKNKRNRNSNEFVKTSENGKDIIKSAIRTKNIVNRNLIDDFWLEEATLIADPDYKINEWRKKRIYYQGINTDSWRTFLYGTKTINISIYNIYCKMLGVNPDLVKEISFESFHGLTKPPEIRDIFNDYLGDRAIHELWADPFAIKHGGKKESFIKASVQQETNKTTVIYFLKINFIRQGYGINLTIRPMNDAPVDASNFTHFKFYIRSPRSCNVGVRIRVTDANNVCWGYVTYNKIYEDKELSSSSNNWTEIAPISLAYRKWFHFDYDGKAINTNTIPDFSIINLISLEVGFEIEDKKRDIPCTLTKFSLNNTKVGEIHISPIQFQQLVKNE